MSDVFISYSHLFFGHIWVNETVEQTFSQTKNKMEWMRAHESQSLRIDVNSNGITKELLDLCALRTTHPGRYFQSATVAGLRAANSSGHIRSRVKES